MRKGDVITAIDGKPAATYTRASLMELLTHDGEKHRFTLTRDGKTLDVTLTLVKQI
ncbi:MAG: PDZ domain-containing protein [Mycobacterium sp.]